MKWLIKIYKCLWSVWFEYQNAKIEAQKKGNTTVRKCFMCNKRMLLFKNDIPSHESIKLVCSDKCKEDFNRLVNKQQQEAKGAN